MSTLKKLPLLERPRERFEQCGAPALSTIELIAIILGSGSQGESVLNLAQSVLAKWGSLSAIAAAPLQDLTSLKGMGRAKSLQLKAALTLASRLTLEKLDDKPLLNTPEAIFNFVAPLYAHAQKEQLAIICLDAKMRATHFEIISIGTLSQTLIHPREVFAPAIHRGAASIHLIHNHPSGDPTPSPQDLKQTARLVEVGRLMGIALNDHLIITKTSYYSILDSGIAR